MQKTQQNITILVLLLLHMLIHAQVSFAAEPLIFGVTDGSIYQDYVKIYWFDDNGVANYSRDGGAAVNYTKGSSLGTDGSYSFTLTTTENGTESSKTVNFAIDSSTQTTLATLEDSRLTNLEIVFSAGIYDAGGPVMAIWAEDMEGNFLQNLYVSNGASTNYMRFSGYAPRAYAIPYWAHSTCPETSTGSSVYLAAPEIPLPEGIDAVSGATQKNGFTLHTSVIPPVAGNSIRVLLEINQSWDSGWYFASSNLIREETDAPSGTTFGSVVGTNGEPSLVYAIEIPLHQPGTYSAADPVGYGHYSGRTGTLYTDFYAENGSTGEQQYKFDYAPLMVDDFSVTVKKLPGDVNGNMRVDLGDAIRCLKLFSGSDVEINPNGDFGDNRRINMEETFYIIHQLSQ